MRYVIIRDDDTNAFTPVECLERLYRPFLARGLPVNLATIPAVSRKATMANGEPEGFLLKKDGAAAFRTDTRGNGPTPSGVAEPHFQAAQRGAAVAGAGDQLTNGDTAPIGSNQALVNYLLANPGYRIVQHGCHHDYLEFERASHSEIVRRLEDGTRLLQEAGFAKPRAFVAPYDKLSRAGLREVAARFRVLSTGWYELRRLPYSWWPRYGFKKLLKAPHWRVGQTLLLSHPGCLLSCHHTYSTMLGGIIHYLQTQQLTVLVTHWWEYFRGAEPNEEFIDSLHETASYVATQPELQAISFEDLVKGDIQLN